VALSKSREVEFTSEYMKDHTVYLNRGERYEDMIDIIDHRSYSTHNLSSCEIKA